MKLLPKSVVNSELASQKKKQIDEGLMIAKKVDALRETLSSLEEQHRRFLGSMEIELKLQTKPLLDEIAHRKAEIKQLSLKREELLVPLTKEWSEVNEERKKIDKITEQMSKERAILNRNNELLEKRLKKEKENIFKTNTIRNELAKILKQQEENERATANTLKTAEVTKTKTLKELEEKTKLIKSRDAEVAVREREVLMQQEELDLERKFINEEKIRLLDQRATLERAFNRIKK